MELRLFDILRDYWFIIVFVILLLGIAISYGKHAGKHNKKDDK